MPGRSSSRVARSQSWAARYAPRWGGGGGGGGPGGAGPIRRPLGGRRWRATAEEGSRHAEEVAFDADGVGVDVDEVALLDRSVGGLRPPGVRVRPRRDRARGEVLASGTEQRTPGGRQEIPLPDAGPDRSPQRP